MQLGSTILNNEVQTAPPTKIEKTWFIERENGAIFACEETEAYSLTHPTQPNAKRYKIVGTSDGRTYVEIMKNAGKEKMALENKIQKLSSDITRYLNTLDKFKFDELLDDTDPKVIRVKDLMDKLQQEIDVANVGLKDIQKSVVEKAFQAELAIAREKIELPRKQDVFCPGGNSDKVLRALNR
jgi:hypothetical protein